MLGILSLLFNGVTKIIGGIFGIKTAEVNDRATVDVASIESMAAVEQRWWFVSLMIPLISLPFALYIWKAVGWDKVIAPHLSWCHHGCATTGPITGTLSWVFTTVIVGLFLHAVTK